LPEAPPVTPGVAPFAPDSPEPPMLLVQPTPRVRMIPSDAAATMCGATGPGVLVGSSVSFTGFLLGTLLKGRLFLAERNFFQVG
jgi:hypothetical protein